MATSLDETKFAPVPISKVSPNEPLCADIYLKINNKFIKYKNKEEELDGDKFNYFISKNLTHLYISIEEVPLFMEWLKSSGEKAVNEMVEVVGEENRDLVEKREEIEEKVFEVFSDQEVDSGLVELLQENVADFVENVKDNKQAQMVLAKLTKQNRSVADHSVNVANISLFMAMLVGNSHQYVLENVYFGGLFHDYGKAKIPASILENSNSATYSQAINDHPEKGRAGIGKIKGVNDQVLMVVEQHHEQHNGQGFPKGLKGDEIYELAKIVSIANSFDNMCLEHKAKPQKDMYRAAIKYLEYDKGKMFDPELLPRIIDGLKLAFGEYYK